MKPNAMFKLKILAGLHKNAEMLLEPQLPYCIGSGDSCDIVLMDAGVAPNHLGLTVTEGKIQVETTHGQIFLDGQPAPYTAFELSPFQVISMGDAHLTVGPIEQPWPSVQVPRRDPMADEPICTDLVLLDADRNLPEIIRQPGFFRRAWQRFKQWVSVTDNKILAAVGVFFLAFMSFIIDASLTTPALPQNIPNTSQIERDKDPEGAPRQTPQKGLLLAAVKGLSDIKTRTLVGTGISEPRIIIQTKTTPYTEDPVSQIRSVLKQIWGDNLTESPRSDQSIELKGFSAEDQQNLLLEIKKDRRGEWVAHGVTDTRKQKQAILSRLGEEIRVQIDVTGEVETACQRVLKKKGIRRPEVRFDMAGKSLTIKGRSKDRHAISTARAIVSKTFPEIGVENKIKLGAAGASHNIRGVSTSGAPHVILSDGSKVFKGGKLKNGCVVVGMKSDHVILSCSGSRTIHRL